MQAKKLRLHEEGAMLRLEIIETGSISLATIESELGAVSMRHGLPPRGGLYLEMCKVADGPSVSRLGGMSLPLDKQQAVFADLKEMGYQIEK